ncbi:MAG: hypothetical protein H3C64_10530 [Candidatus Kuenenia stuttgartiensis]|nr:hypothetical protein [Candidatus Kuenenia stuttgartiensis]
MDDREKSLIKLRFGLALTRLLDERKAIGKKNKLEGIKDRNLVDSYLKLERASGLPKATIIGIFQGRINAASSSLAVILEALETSFTNFGEQYDSITEDELLEFSDLLAQKRQAQFNASTKSAKEKRQGIKNSVKGKKQ